MDRHIVKIIHLNRLGHALFLYEDSSAQGAAEGDVTGFLDQQCHAK
jgi:hypothetical protein